MKIFWKIKFFSYSQRFLSKIWEIVKLTFESWTELSFKIAVGFEVRFLQFWICGSVFCNFWMHGIFSMATKNFFVFHQKFFKCFLTIFDFFWLFLAYLFCFAGYTWNRRRYLLLSRQYFHCIVLEFYSVQNNRSFLRNCLKIKNRFCFTLFFLLFFFTLQFEFCSSVKFWKFSKHDFWKKKSKFAKFLQDLISVIRSLQ